MCDENRVSRDAYLKATSEPYSFLYIDNPKKRVLKNFIENIK